MDKFSIFYQKLEELQSQGLKGNALGDELIKWSKEEKPFKKLGLHDMFNVSKGEEKSWYDESSRKFRSFQELTDYFVKTGCIDVRVGYIRKTIRRFRKEAREFFLYWLSILENLCDQTVFDEYSTLSDETLTTFESICYFAAETHDVDFFEPVLKIISSLHYHDGDVEFIPIYEFVCQHLHSIFYNICPADFDLIMEHLLDPNLDWDINKALGFMMAQFCINGVFSNEKQWSLLNSYVQFIFENGFDGDAAAQWIVKTHKKDSMREQLQKLLEEYIDPMYYGTTDPEEFYKMTAEDPAPLCQKGIVMDDMILYGMYRKAIHAPEQIRRRAVQDQEQRIMSFKSI